MHRLRIYLTSTIAGLASAVAVLWISVRIERQRAAEYMERLRNAPPDASGFQGGVGYVAAIEFGPGLFTWLLVALVFAAGFYWLLRWQNR